LDEEKSKCTGLAQENGFWLSIIVQLTFTFIHLMDEKIEYFSSIQENGFHLILKILDNYLHNLPIFPMFHL